MTDKKASNIKLIAVDMDGTLVNDRKEMPKDFIPWIKAHKNKKIVIASGRAYYTNVALFGDAAKDMIFLSDNGGVIYENGSFLYQKGLETEEVIKCIRLFEGNPLTEVILCAADQSYLHDPAGDEDYQWQVDTYYINHTYTEDLEQAAKDHKIIKVSVYIREKKAQEVFDSLPELSGELKASVGGPEWIDIGNKTVDKGAGLKILEEIKGVSREETMAFGDYMNDYTMLQEAGESYAMENAIPEIKKIAKYQAPSNNDEGVMKVLKKVFD